MVSSGMLRRVALVRTDISEERIAPINIVTRLGELGKTLPVTSNRSTAKLVLLRSVFRLLVTAKVPSSLIIFTLMMEVIRSSETSVLTRATLRNVPEYDIIQSHPHENFKSYITQTNSVALSPQANYTDVATATCRKNLVPTSVVRLIVHALPLSHFPL
jgi:hypothetical protein